MYEEFSPAKPGEGWYWLNVRAGRHHLNGHQALAYVRNRSDSWDGNRMRRQRCMLRAIAAEMTPTTLLTRFHQIAEAIKNSTTTNIPLSGVPEFIEVASSLDFADITSFAIGAPAHSLGKDFRWLPMLDADAARQRVAEGLAGLEEGLDFTESEECPAPRG